MLNMEKAAELLNVSKPTVRRLIKIGKLKAYKIGGQLRIKLTDLLAFIEQHLH